MARLTIRRCSAVTREAGNQTGGRRIHNERLHHLIDQDYIRERNAFIPIAEKRANKEFGRQSPKGKDVKVKTEYTANWNRVYHAELERLWRERGRPR